jgi:hypothetical protein
MPRVRFRFHGGVKSYRSRMISLLRLPQEQQDQPLDEAESGDWSRSRIRDKVKLVRHIQAASKLDELETRYSGQSLRSAAAHLGCSQTGR